MAIGRAYRFAAIGATPLITAHFTIPRGVEAEEALQ